MKRSSEVEDRGSQKAPGKAETIGKLNGEKQNYVQKFLGMEVRGVIISHLPKIIQKCLKNKKHHRRLKVLPISERALDMVLPGLKGESE